MTGRAERIQRSMQAVVDAVLGAPGDADPVTRRAAFALGAKLGGRRDPDGGAGLPSELRPLLEKVARHTYRVTDRDVQEVREAGYSEDELFEVILAVAAGAGVARLERGLAVISEAEASGGGVR